MQTLLNIPSRTTRPRPRAATQLSAPNTVQDTATPPLTTSTPITTRVAVVAITVRRRRYWRNRGVAGVLVVWRSGSPAMGLKRGTRRWYGGWRRCSLFCGLPSSILPTRTPSRQWRRNRPPARSARRRQRPIIRQQPLLRHMEGGCAWELVFNVFECVCVCVMCVYVYVSLSEFLLCIMCLSQRAFIFAFGMCSCE